VLRYLILTEGGSKYGLGHIARCISFYDAIEKQGDDVAFVIQGDRSVEKLIGNRSMFFKDWHSNLSEILENISKSSAIIVDSYYLRQIDADLLSNCEAKVLIIEDFLRLNYTDTTIVDWSLGAECLSCYSNKEKTNTYLLGPTYLALRKPFWNVATEERNSYNSLLITMGGSDIRNLSFSLLTSIKCKFPYLHINLVIGPSFENINEFQDLKMDNVDMYFSPNEEKMCEIMAQSDFAISGGGQTLYELYAMGLSIIAIELIENQHDELKKWKEYSMLQFAGKWNDSNLLERVNESIGKHLDCPGCFKVIGKEPIDTKGVFRILNSFN